MQFDHCALALLRDIGSEARALTGFSIIGHPNVLIADKPDTARQHNRADQANRSNEEPGQRLRTCADGAIGLAFNLHSRCLRRVQHREAERIRSVKPRQENPRQQRRLEQRTDRENRRFTQIGQRIGTARKLRPRLLPGRIEIAHQRSQKNDHNRGRNDLPQGARGRNHARGQFGRVVVAQHRRQRQKPHRHHGCADDPGRGGQEGTHDHNRHRQTARQRAKDARHAGQKVFGDFGPFERDAHQNEHQNRQKGFDRLARDDAFVHPVDDERDIAVHRLFPTADEERLFDPWQFWVSEDRYGFAHHPFGNQRGIFRRTGVDCLVDQQASAIKRRDDRK